MEKKILFLVAHPNIEKSVLNKNIVQNIKSKKNIIIRKLYNIYPNFKIRIEEEIRIISNVKFIVFQFPLYWYSYPSLLKEWKDKVLTNLYNNENKILSGKHLLVSITTGSEKKTFHAGERNNFTIDEFLRPIQQTAHVCNMTYHGYVHFSIHMLNTINHSLKKHTDEIILKINKYI
ncbi:MAG: NAD(P)H-dependent oxidoreductase [Flavobacteriales bacterium]|jgi:glutathione-regulated potassium-efflux system ancillary protein KefG|uniref:NAD(P)H-dependent oxidoreductase n=1 Tax=Blattabacterium sp. (Mastotermes darwiniensis) TaxID=39768 RepID=UPI000231DF41|nr:NAD(P)H-dependent oxidoreductase [Blattabacterium sp. (Mastotermes darwiniensis)]AER40350.1 asparaginyl-tRNA synthetase [Blattabacterium sp. (Mastotermes darwiniensis) str. MADAR]MDR1804929.1 NAD(P)H-dependent oxidoreductase [Flavobacteriales bacterium]